MRDVVAQARLEHAEALGHANRPAIAIGERDHAAATLVQRARAPCQQDEAEQAKISDQEILLDALQHGLLKRRADLARRKILRPPFDAIAVDDASSGLIETQHGQRRNQHHRRKQKWRGALVERFHPQPEVKSDAAVDPGNDHDSVHQPHFERPYDPVREEHLRIELFVSEEGLAEPHAGKVGDDERGDAQAEHELEWLDRLPAKLPAFVERPDSEPVVEKVAHQIGEQHQPAAETNLADADAADELCDLFLRERGHAIQSNAHQHRSTIVEFNSIADHLIRVAIPASERSKRKSGPIATGASILTSWSNYVSPTNACGYGSRRSPGRR